MESEILVERSKEKMTIFEGMAILKKFFNKAEAAGCNLEDFNRLLTEQGDSAIDKFVEVTLDLRPRPVSYFKYDKAKSGWLEKGWKLLEDVPFYGQPFDFDLVEFLKPGESYVNGEEMKQRAIKLNAHLGQGHAEYLEANQDRIPKEFRDKYYLVFPGTVWRGSGGDRYVPCLRWDGDRWCLHFGWLRVGWDSNDRLVCLRK